MEIKVFGCQKKQAEVRTAGRLTKEESDFSRQGLGGEAGPLNEEHIRLTDGEQLEMGRCVYCRADGNR